MFSDALKSFQKLVFGPSKPVIRGRPANETDRANIEWKARQRAEVEASKKEFHQIVGPLTDHPPLVVKPRARPDSPNPSFVSSVPETITPATVAESLAIPGSTPSADATPLSSSPPPQQPAGSVPVRKAIDVQRALGRAIRSIEGSELKDNMTRLNDQCDALAQLLDEVTPSVKDSSQYGYALSAMYRDLDDVSRFINTWNQQSAFVRVNQRQDMHLQVRKLEQEFVQHITLFTAICQRHDSNVTSQNLNQIHEKLDSLQSLQNQARDQLESNNVGQADARMITQQVQAITGHSPDADFILKGVISYRENVAVNHGFNFDIFRGQLNTGEMIAIKLYREKNMLNDSNGVKFVERIMRQVQFWTSFCSPYILQCYGVGMQMTKVADGQGSYDKFQFYLVSPFMRRGNAVEFIQTRRKAGTYVNIFQYIQHAALGVQYLHHRSPPCVHASIRGENVIMKDDDTACLNGFGLTKALSVTKAIELTGKNFQCRWMAPELLNRDRPPLKPECDVWSWAMTALELITGLEPYYQIDAQWNVPPAITSGQIPQRTDYPTFEKYCPQPDMTWALLEKCWTMDPDQRPKIDEVVAELERIEKVQIEAQMATTHSWC
ncbi:kinase-like protein [Ceratobasidium sp. AG-I]|nr:kinase-like protein [Ceratobasidium sp. AG-I]